jgi:hypothetical protein
MGVAFAEEVIAEIRRRLRNETGIEFGVLAEPWGTARLEDPYILVEQAYHLVQVTSAVYIQWLT